MRCEYFGTIVDRIEISLRAIIESSLLHRIIYRSARPERRRMNSANRTSGQFHSLAHDLLRGADQIADFLFGDASQRRKVYYLAETSRLPVFRLGSKLCARRSVLMAWIVSQEKRGWQSGRIEICDKSDRSDGALNSEVDAQATDN
jgi:hypothetical protein